MVGRPGYVLVDGRFIPADIAFSIEYPEAAARQRESKRASTRNR